MSKPNKLHSSLSSSVDSRQSQCRLCFKPRHTQRSLSLLLSDDPLCGSCRSQFPLLHRLFWLDRIKVLGCYRYEGSVSHRLVQFKDHQDVSLAPIFIWPIRAQLRRFLKGSYAIYAPSSAAKTRERGYFPLEALYQSLRYPIYHHFEKAEVEQKHQSVAKRALIHQSIQLNIPLPHDVKSITLVEDVITTGATLNALIDRLQPFNGHLQVLALALHPLWCEKAALNMKK